MGWTLQHIRLRCQGNKEEGGPVECHHRGIFHRRFPRGTWWRQSHAQRSHIMCHPPGRHRGRQHWIQPNDRRKHEIGRSSTPTCSGRALQRRSCRSRIKFSPHNFLYDRGFLMTRGGRSGIWLSTFGYLHLRCTETAAVGVLNSPHASVLYLYHNQHGL